MSASASRKRACVIPPDETMNRLPSRAAAASAATKPSATGPAAAGHAKNLVASRPNIGSSRHAQGVEAASANAAISEDFPTLDGPFSTTTKPASPLRNPFGRSYVVTATNLGDRRSSNHSTASHARRSSEWILTSTRPPLTRTSVTSNPDARHDGSSSRAISAGSEAAASTPSRSNSARDPARSRRRVSCS